MIRWLFGMLLFAVLFPFVAIGFVGCGGGEPGPLVVYSGRSQSLVDGVIEQFTNATGIEVVTKYASTSDIASTLMEEGSRTRADIFFAQDPGGLGVIKGMMDVLPDSLLAQTPEWARSPDGKWVGISGRARVVVYNNATLSQTDLPQSLEGFTDPKWKGKIGWPPRNSSFQTMVTAMRTLWGEEKTKQWLLDIKANDPKEYAKNTPTVAAVESGEVEVGFVNHYYLYRFLREEGESFQARNHHLVSGGPGSLVMVAGAGILETSDNKDAAKRFLKFLLSKEGQQYFASETFEYPLVDGIRAERGLIPLSEINKPSVNLGVDLKDLKGTQRLLRETGIIP